MTERNPLDAAALRRAAASQRRRRSRGDQGWMVAEFPTGWTVIEIPSTPWLLLAVGSEMCGRGSAGDCSRGCRSSSPVRRGGCKEPWRRGQVEVRRSRARCGSEPQRPKDGDGRPAKGSLAIAFAENNGGVSDRRPASEFFFGQLIRIQCGRSFRQVSLIARRIRCQLLQEPPN